MNSEIYDNLWMRRMFDAVPARYNFLNKILTIGKDEIWRNKALNLIDSQEANRILDICTGTGDLALKMAKRFPRSKIYAIDFSYKMLAYAKKRAKDMNVSNITFIQTDCSNLGFRNNYFDYITISFGFRNLAYSGENLIESLKEIYRVLRNKGKMLILETSQPLNMLIKNIFHFYATKIVPAVGKLFSGQNQPYQYLGNSIVKFFNKNELNSIMAQAGFSADKFISFLSGSILLSEFKK